MSSGTIATVRSILLNPTKTLVLEAMQPSVTYDTDLTPMLNADPKKLREKTAPEKTTVMGVTPEFPKPFGPKAFQG